MVSGTENPPRAKPLIGLSAGKDSLVSAQRVGAARHASRLRRSCKSAQTLDCRTPAPPDQLSRSDWDLAVRSDPELVIAYTHRTRTRPAGGLIGRR